MSQYALSLSLPAVFSEENFFVSGCNKEAWQWVTSWPEWPSNALLIYGPEGSGKTHLGHIWAARARAETTDADDHTFTPEGLSGHLLVEHLQDGTDEAKLFHTINFCRENNFSLLLTSMLPPKQLPFKLPDLTSRLLGMQSVAISAPDDEVLAAAMRKQFADRQLKVSDEVISYLLPRIERSYAKAAQLVGNLDHQALAEQKNLTIPFIRKMLGDL